MWTGRLRCAAALNGAEAGPFGLLRCRGRFYEGFSPGLGGLHTAYPGRPFTGRFGPAFGPGLFQLILDSPREKSFVDSVAEFRDAPSEDNEKLGSGG